MTFSNNFCFFVLISFFCVPVVAQENSSALGNEKIVANSYIENYFNVAVGKQARIYNGRQYEFDNPAIKGSALFMDTVQFVNGNVTYEGFRFENVPLIYDLYRDALITKVENDQSAFTLINERVTNFSLYNHNFLRIDAGSNDKIITGYYDLIFDGKIRVFVKRSKSIQEKLDNTVQKYFLPATSYFIEKENQYYKISSESAFISLFKQERQFLRQKLNESKLKFRKNPEETLVMLANYYNTLKN